MEITILNSNKNIQTQKLNDLSSDPVKKITTEETEKYAQKNQVDTSEISSSHSGSFDDKKLMIAKSAILYDVTVGTSPQKIEELKTSVDNGTYDVPSEKIADAIIIKA
ncbi:MAG: flagellar biosynthesis anti-sigma factor FlgM [Eubacteriales bacterium]|nr:flagellar biosynthesis anti-sigma factor FlgM [Eubacteriales bacterium]MDD3350666.1 flagellar biosynthesis anti-sigma factor FlgM [Eubacteriales bacterium]